MTAAYNVWGNVGNAAYAVPMAKLVPAIPASQGYTLAWNIVEQAVDYAPLSFDFSTGNATLAGNFQLTAGKSYVINGFQVITGRIQGWTAPTGTATRSTFATGTVTTTQLAERVKALIDDLMSHGLIGV